jgi:hypothetical protein
MADARVCPDVVREEGTGEIRPEDCFDDLVNELAGLRESRRHGVTVPSSTGGKTALFRDSLDSWVVRCQERRKSNGTIRRFDVAARMTWAVRQTSRTAQPAVGRLGHVSDSARRDPHCGGLSWRTPSG